MRGDLRAVSIRSLPRPQRWPSSEWVRALKARRRRARQEQLELIEQLHRHERQRIRAGEGTPERLLPGRWS